MRLVTNCDEELELLTMRSCGSFCGIAYDLVIIIDIHIWSVFFIPISPCTHTNYLVEFVPLTKRVICSVNQYKPSSILHVFLKSDAGFFRPWCSLPAKV